MYVVTLFSLLFYLYSYGCNVMFCVSPVSPLLFSRAYRFFSRVAAESAVWGICRFLRRGCVFRRGWCFCLGWYNWKVETPSETFAKFLLPPNSRNLIKDFRLFLFQISTDSTQIPPLIPLGYLINQASGPPFRRQQAHLAC